MRPMFFNFSLFNSALAPLKCGVSSAIEDTVDSKALDSFVNEELASQPERFPRLDSERDTWISPESEESSKWVSWETAKGTGPVTSSSNYSWSESELLRALCAFKTSETFCQKYPNARKKLFVNTLVLSGLRWSKLRLRWVELMFELSINFKFSSWQRRWRIQLMSQTFVFQRSPLTTRPLTKTALLPFCKT